MELRDLSRDERIALVGLIEYLVESDTAVSEQEIDQIQAIAAELGEAEFRSLADEVDRRFDDAEALRTFLKTIVRTEARELIFEKALETAIPDGILTHESEMLEWLEREWRIDVEIGDA